jgi:transcriptional regulator with XRE-family HTH domain
MNGDRSNDSMTSIPSVSLFRGIYNRVAKKLGVDPSYVSRVARGERKSAVVEKALAEEVRIIREHLNDHENNHNHNHNHNKNHSAPGTSLDAQRKESKANSRRDGTLEV